jgi:hypothetical protein
MDRRDDPHALSGQLEHQADELDDSVQPDDQPAAG